MPHSCQLVSFGSSKAGLTTIGFIVYSEHNVALTDRITAGIHDIGQGQYETVIDLPEGFIGYITWDTGETPPIRASGDINLQSETAAVDAMLATLKNVSLRPTVTVLGPCSKQVDPAAAIQDLKILQIDPAADAHDLRVPPIQ